MLCLSQNQGCQMADFSAKIVKFGSEYFCLAVKMGTSTAKSFGHERFELIQPNYLPEINALNS